MITLSDFYYYIQNGLDVRSLLIVTAMSLLAGAFIWFTSRVTGKKNRFTRQEEAGIFVVPILIALVVFSSQSLIALVIAIVAVVAAFAMRLIIFKREETVRTLCLWGVAAGVCIGEENYLAAAICCVTVFFVLLIFGMIRNDEICYLVIRGSSERTMAAEGVVFRIFQQQAILKVKVEEDRKFELIYAINEKELQKAEENRLDVSEELLKIDGIKYVKIVKEEKDIGKIQAS